MKSQAKKRPLHRSIDYHRVESDRVHRPGSLEQTFAEEWEKENKPRPGLNYGHGILQDLMFTRDGVNTSCRFVIRRRDAAIAATVVQWLGTNVGFCFLEGVLRKAGYRVMYPHETRREAKRRAAEEVLAAFGFRWIA